jgi:hypothetical protein
MKLKNVLVLTVFMAVTAVSCKKDAASPPQSANLSAEIKNFVSQQTLDSLRTLGAVINEGTTPPTLDGIFNFTPVKCIRDNSNVNKLGVIFNDQRYKFSNLNPVSKEIIVLTKDLVLNEVLTSTQAFIAGNGNKFSVFINSTGPQYGIPTKVLTIISGELNGLDISNLTYTFYIDEKGPDPTNKLINAKTGRVFEDTDKITQRTNTF